MILYAYETGKKSHHLGELGDTKQLCVVCVFFFFRNFIHVQLVQAINTNQWGGKQRCKNAKQCDPE